MWVFSILLLVEILYNLSTYALAAASIQGPMVTGMTELQGAAVVRVYLRCSKNAVGSCGFVDVGSNGTLNRLEVKPHGNRSRLWCQVQNNQKGRSSRKPVWREISTKIHQPSLRSVIPVFWFQCSAKQKWNGTTFLQFAVLILFHKGERKYSTDRKEGEWPPGQIQDFWVHQQSHQTPLNMDFGELKKSKRWPSYGWQNTKTKDTSSFVFLGSFPTQQPKQTQSLQLHIRRFSEFRSNMASVGSNTPKRPEAKRLHKAKHRKGKSMHDARCEPWHRTWKHRQELGCDVRIKAKIWINSNTVHSGDTTARLWFIPSVWIFHLLQKVTHKVILGFKPANF